MVEIILSIIVVAEAFVIFSLWQKKGRLANEYSSLRRKYEEEKSLLKEMRLQADEQDRTVDRLAVHDRIVEMYDAGSDIDMISQDLKIPRKKVEMTLKFQKMKHDGA